MATLNKRVFLTNPPLNMAETPLQYHRPLVPMGLAYLGAILEEEFTGGRWENYFQSRLAGTRSRGYRRSGHVAAQDNMFLSFYGNYDLDALIQRIEQHAEGCPQEELYIGLSILSDGVSAARSMLKRIRHEFPRATIMVGGPHATFFPQDFYADPEHRKDPLADYVVKNEGEQAILAIVKDLIEDKAGLEAHAEEYGINVAECDYSDPEYRIIEGGQYKAQESGFAPHVLDDLPPPAYFLFEDHSGNLPYEPDRRYGLEAPAANINSSRGCPHNCTFCTIPQLAPGYRSLSPARMTELCTFLSKEYGVQSIFFREDNFMYSGGNVEGDRWKDVSEFCERVQGADLDLRWAIEARADNLVQPAENGKTRLRKLQNAGLTGIYIGVESGSDLMLKRYGKGADVEAMSEAIQACHGHEISVVATSCYSDPDLLLRPRYSEIDPNDPEYQASITEDREQILQETRSFMDEHEIPHGLREEYAMVGIPVSTIYNLLGKERDDHPFLVEHYDTESRYIFPKGFKWWADKVYEEERRVRPYHGFNYKP